MNRLTVYGAKRKATIKPEAQRIADYRAQEFLKLQEWENRQAMEFVRCKSRCIESYRAQVHSPKYPFCMSKL